MKRIYLFTAALLVMVTVGLTGIAQATEKSRAALQTDLDTYKLRHFNPGVNYDRLTDLTDSFFSLTTDTLDDVNDGSTYTRVPAADSTKLQAVTATAVELNQAADLDVNSEVVTTTNSIAASECGELFFISSTTGFASTLPAPTQGCKFWFNLTTDSTGISHTIVTSGSETIKGFTLDASGGNSTGSQAADTITFNSASAVPGDRVDLFSDGTSWLAIGFSSASGAIAFSSAI